VCEGKAPQINDGKGLMETRRVGIVGSLLALSLFSIGCGSSNNSSSAFNQTQALTATSDLFAAMSSATFATGLLRTPVVQQTEVDHIRYANLNGTPSVAVANFIATPRATTPITMTPYTYKCPISGTIVVTGSYTGTATSSTLDIVETINSCSDTGFTINGNPNVTLTDSFSISGNTATDVMTMTGGFTDGSQSCSINVTVNATVNDQTDVVSGTMSGSVCGVSVNSTL
jgi:hypothetical protein